MDIQSYRLLCDRESTISLFSQPWWLDAVTGKENWDVAMVEKGGQIMGCLPYIKKKKGIFSTLNMPQLTPYLGVWIKYPSNQNSATAQLSYDKKIFTELIEKLPSYHYFNQRFHYNIQNWLPFYWKDFQQTTRYTYFFPDISNLSAVYENIQGNVKRDIKKAETLLTVETTNDVALFYETYRKVFERQGESATEFSLIEKIDDACKTHECREIFLAKTATGDVAAVLYLVWDAQCAYHLMGGYNPAHKITGAVSLLLWEAIQFAAQRVRQFDCKGSMIEPIESFYRSFGGIQTPYFQISKVKHPLLKLYFALK